MAHKRSTLRSSAPPAEEEDPFYREDVDIFSLAHADCIETDFKLPHGSVNHAYRVRFGELAKYVLMDLVNNRPFLDADGDIVWPSPTMVKRSNATGGYRNCRRMGVELVGEDDDPPMSLPGPGPKRSNATAGYKDGKREIPDSSDEEEGAGALTDELVSDEEPQLSPKKSPARSPTKSNIKRSGAARKNSNPVTKRRQQRHITSLLVENASPVPYVGAGFEGPIPIEGAHHEAWKDRHSPRKPTTRRSTRRTSSNKSSPTHGGHRYSN